LGAKAEAKGGLRCACAKAKSVTHSLSWWEGFIGYNPLPRLPSSQFFSRILHAR